MEFTKEVLSNGTELYVVQSDLYTTTNLQIDFYSRMNKTEAAKTLVAEVLLEGSKHYQTLPDISKATDGQYSALSSHTSQIGDLHSITFGIDTLTTEKIIGKQKTLENMLGILKDIISKPIIEQGNFKREYFQKQKKELILRLQQEDLESRIRAFKRFSQIALGNSNFAYPPQGTVKQVERTWNPEVLKAYSKMLSSFPRKIFVGTNLNPKYISDVVQNTFGWLSPVRDEMRIGKVPQKKSKSVEEISVFEQTLVMVGFPAEVSKDPKQREKLYLLNYCIGGSSNAKLFNEIRMKRGIAYYAYSYVAENSGLLVGFSGVDIKNKDTTVDVMLKEISGIANNLTEDEFEETKNSILNSRKMVIHQKSMRLQNLKRAVFTDTLEEMARFEDRFKDITYGEVLDAAELIDKKKPIVYCQLQEAKK